MQIPTKWVLCLIVLVLLPIVVYLYFGYKPIINNSVYRPVATISYKQEVAVKPMEPGAEFRIETIELSDGFIYNLLLENNTWIDARLIHATKEAATRAAVELLRLPGVEPSVILYRRMDRYWLVDIHVNYEGKRQSLTEIFKDLDLAF